MLIAQEAALMEIFRERAAADRRELRFFLDAEHAIEQRDVRMRHEEEERRDLAEMELASNQQIAAFRDRLDHYDTAVIGALMDNEEALNKVRQRREDIESKAYRLPDGRIVFKTDDGTGVVDKNDKQVPRDVIDPGAIPGELPKASAYRSVIAEEKRLEKERDELHDYQRKLDDARDTIDKGGVTAKQLDDLDNDLKNSMPDAVRRKVPGLSPEPAAVSPQASGPTPGLSPDIGDPSTRRPAASPFSPR